MLKNAILTVVVLGAGIGTIALGQTAGTPPSTNPPSQNGAPAADPNGHGTAQTAATTGNGGGTGTSTKGSKSSSTKKTGTGGGNGGVGGGG